MDGNKIEQINAVTEEILRQKPEKPLKSSLPLWSQHEKKVNFWEINLGFHFWTFQNVQKTGVLYF